MGISEEVTSAGTNPLVILLEAEKAGDIEGAVHALNALVGSWDQSVLDTAHRFFGNYAGAVGAAAAHILVAASAYPFEVFCAHLADRVKEDAEFGPYFVHGLFSLGTTGLNLLINLMEQPLFAGIIADALMKNPSFREARVVTALRRALASGKLERSWNAAITDAFDFIDGRRTTDLPVPPQIGHNEKRLIETEPMLRSSKSHTLAVNDVDLNPEGNLLATAGLDRTVRTWSTVAGEQRGIWFDHSGSADCVKFSNDGTHLYSGGAGGVLIIDLEASTVVRQVGLEQGTVSHFDLTRDEKLMVCADIDARARTWNFETGEMYAQFGFADSVSCVAAYPTGEMVATGGNNGKMSLWNPKTGEKLTSMSSYDGPVSGISFGCKRRLVAVATDNSVTIWDIDRETALVTCKGHEARITGTCFHPTDVEILLTVSSDGMARIWRWRKNETLEILADGTMTKAKFSRCGNFVTTCGVDGTAAIWRAVKTG